MNKVRSRTTNARAFLAEWQKRYKITLHDISEDILQAMEQYAGQKREEAAHPDVEQILKRVADHDITPAKAMELLQNWSDCAAGPADFVPKPQDAREPQDPKDREIRTYPISDWE